MEIFRPLSRRHDHRLDGYDYAQAGAYFLTIVTLDRELLFDLPELKATVEKHWLWLGEHHDYVFLDEFVVMPNHLHGIVLLDAPDGAVAAKSIGSLIGAFKTVSTQEISALRDMPGERVWQRNYYDRIIRDDEELNRIREYIIDNPRRWDEDPENPNAVELDRRSPFENGSDRGGDRDRSV